MPASTRGNWSKAAIGGLVLLNLVLFGLLVLRQPSSSADAVPVPIERAPSSQPPSSPGASSDPPTPGSEASAPNPDAGPTPTGTSIPVVTSRRLLAVNSESLAWRGTFGPCPTAPDIEVTRDGGRTWRPAPVDLRSASRLRSFGGSAVFAVGGSKDCAARYLATGGPADDWRANDDMLAETWYRLPDAPYRVQAPGGRISRPCGEQLNDLAGLGDDNAAAVCADGTLRMTRSGGRTWRDLEDGRGGLAVGADDGVFVLAQRRTGCEGVAVTVVDPEVDRDSSDEPRCAPVDPTGTNDVAVSVRDQVIWLWAGSEVAITEDRGRTWRKA